ncbi:hypothetical protein GQR93_03035 [Lentilactobacillus hilgardii]|uniref:Phage holin n=1 Tax=Lentilactobacillus hilgardii TaxID=1588 RepID=A0A6P1E686_LENHI|nr:hypothetical protein [Lentilactobacillus hilgardii]QHB51272.1 hypothetical protein GQR93_03035 [Lentilactobacillus hilgardii]
MFTHILDVFNSLKATGVVAFFVAVIPVVYKLINPYLQKKIATEKNVHAQQALELGLKLANVIVPELAVLAALSKSDRKKEAIRFVNDQLKANGFDLDYQVIAGLVEKAYQAYKATGADNHFAPITPAPVESENSQSAKSIDATGNVSQTSQATEKGGANA